MVEKQASSAWLLLKEVGESAYFGFSAFRPELQCTVCLQLLSSQASLTPCQTLGRFVNCEGWGLGSVI